MACKITRDLHAKHVLAPLLQELSPLSMNIILAFKFLSKEKLQPKHLNTLSFRLKSSLSVLQLEQ
ncbi:hypothetical protein, partial [Helicobacter salomonis]